MNEIKIEDVDATDYSDTVERIFRCNDIDGIKFWGPAVVHACRIQFSQITRLKAELELRTKERDQAIEVTELEECDKTEHPELYEHLWHLAELRNDLRAMRGE